jgi:hypothetical protein
MIYPKPGPHTQVCPYVMIYPEPGPHTQVCPYAVVAFIFLSNTI